MACAGCTINTQDGPARGCGSSGRCGTTGCNRLNTYDWLSTAEIADVDGFDIVEVSFKNGARKAFFRNPPATQTFTGDYVVVETNSGYDLGRITLSGELVRLQMKRRKVNENSVTYPVLRRANERDLEKLSEARILEKSTMIKSRVIARTLGLDMKIGDVEYQADKRKATFYYTADGRVDFRELIRHYAKEFRVKIEMRQIGARQESARIGGIGSCGRELCCSTWLTDFKSVSTAAARYQNLAINQTKLSGQCGRLKCCLNYELDTYMEALEVFPEKAEKLRTAAGIVVLVKTDIFRRLMFYMYEGDPKGKTYALSPDTVREIKARNEKGDFPADLVDLQAQVPSNNRQGEGEQEEQMDFESVNDVLELPAEVRKKKRKKKNRNRNRPSSGQNQQTPGQKTNPNTNPNPNPNPNRNRNRGPKRPPKKTDPT